MHNLHAGIGDDAGNAVDSVILILQFAMSIYIDVNTASAASRRRCTPCQGRPIGSHSVLASLPSASAACLEACFPRGTLPPLQQGERQFVGSYAKDVLQRPQHSLGWLEKMAAWEQRGGQLMTLETLDLTDQLVRAYRRSLALEGPLGFAVRERQRIRLQETGYPFRWEAMNAWCLQHRLDQHLGAGNSDGRRERL